MNTTHCRISKQDDLIQVVDLGNHYFCGHFPSDKDQQLDKGSLRLGWSPSSGLLQLCENLPVETMYGENYGYRSGLNGSMVAHLKDKVHKLINTVALDDSSVVLDIGSNDGTLLSFYPENVLKVGIDPTSEKFKNYYKSDIVRKAAFFSADEYFSLTKSRAKIITSISMFYDLPDPHSFVEQIKNCLHPEGIWNLEQSYMPSMLRTNSYDTICQEHIEYYSLHVIKDLVEAHDLRISEVVFNKINGGSFSVTVCHNSSSRHSNTPIINWMLAQEYRMGLHTPNPYRAFETKAYEHRSDLLDLVRSLNKSGSTVAGYGASTKGNVILQFCGLNQTDIFAIAEVNDDKYDKFTPGSLIPIHSENYVKSQNPDYMLVLPWHFRETIIEKEHHFLANGGKLIFPLPEIEIFG